MALVALSLVPVTAGMLRLVQLAGGPVTLPASHRLVAFPAPLVVHIVAATAYALLGVLQLVPRFRRRHPAWHRRAGRVVSGAGLLVAVSALWLTLVPEPQPGTGIVLFCARLVFSTGMAVCLVLGVRAARRREIPRHRAWMIRAYAIGLAAGTQVFTEGLAEALAGSHSTLTGDLAKLCGWIINLAVAEWAIRHPRAPRRSSRSRPRLGVVS
jgi:uncharacterized membrane protein